jgi:hypothetical protein
MEILNDGEKIDLTEKKKETIKKEITKIETNVEKTK